MVNELMVCVSSTSPFHSSVIHNNNNSQLSNSSSTVNSFQNHETQKQVQKSNKINSSSTSTSICSSSSKEMKECRICQEEDEDNSLESPCACNGSLKYAHRMCIQKWCNKKGDITCEICNQVFSPNYSLPPRSDPDVMAIDISQAWGHHFGFRDHHLLTLAGAERQLLESEYDDYTVANAGNVAYLRSMAIILMFVLLIHQVLMVTRDFGLMQGYLTFFHFEITALQLAGLLLPCYVLARSWYVLYTRRRRQGLAIDH